MVAGKHLPDGVYTFNKGRTDIIAGWQGNGGRYRGLTVRGFHTFSHTRTTITGSHSIDNTNYHGNRRIILSYSHIDLIVILYKIIEK